MSFVAVPQISNGGKFLKGTKIASRRFSRFAAGSGALLCALGFAGGAQGATLTIDLSDPSAVRVVGSGENAANDSQSSLYFSQGITLQNFFNLGVPFNGGGVAVSSDLTSIGSPALMFTTALSTTQNGLPGVTLRQLNLSNPLVPTVPLAFTRLSPALSGTAVFDLSALQAYFPNATFSSPVSGNLYAGLGTGGNTIGTWTAVPEVSTNAQMAVVGLGCATFLVQRARRAKL